MKNKVVNYLTLFSSASTLICCALPALFITIGAGSTLAWILGSFPQLVYFSMYKTPIFIFSGMMLIIGGYFNFKSPKNCPTDFQKECQETKKFSKVIYIISLSLFTIGGFMTYVAPRLF